MEKVFQPSPDEHHTYFHGTKNNGAVFTGENLMCVLAARQWRVCGYTQTLVCNNSHYHEDLLAAGQHIVVQADMGLTQNCGLAFLAGETSSDR